MASGMEDVLSFLLKSDSLRVFSSYADGWGSCLDKLDGSIEPSSDIDVTVMSGRQPIHPVVDAQLEANCQAEHMLAEYKDGHVFFRSGFKPNFSIEKSKLGMVDAFDIIVALDCCSYPSIELLQDGYRTRTGRASCMPERIIELLRAEVFGDSPKCHAVAASPPNLPAGSCMRVSTTLLERSVMQNLTDIQGQFFIIVKFLIKRVLSDIGLKTYIAKNLLFYMLDETPVEKWQTGSHLIELVRTSLEILVEMMESTDSEDACMKHFFLRDANVYFKKEHKKKAEIVASVKQTLVKIHEEIGKFADSLTELPVGGMQFHALFSLHLLAEVHIAAATGTERDAIISAFGEVRDATWPCLKFQQKIQGPEVQFDGAKSAILGMLQEPNPLRLQLRDGKIVACTLENELTPLAKLIAAMRDGTVPSVANVFTEMLQSTPLLPMLINYRKVEQPRALSELRNFTRHLRTIVTSFSPASLIEDDID
uniref:Mab-21 domain-containing protein n=1 Tax=Macrostomum lignano TaxID=282301 RepID=A0A1I8H9W4_9PLAT